MQIEHSDGRIEEVGPMASFMIVKLEDQIETAREIARLWAAAFLAMLALYIGTFAVIVANLS